MNFALKSRVAVVLALLPMAGAVQAAYVVDTGTPIYDRRWVLGPEQSLGVSFSLLAPTPVDSIEVFVGGVGTVEVNLYTDTPNGLHLFTTWGSTSVEGWMVLPTSSLTLGAATYALTLASSDNMSMRSGAPTPLATEWFRNNNAGGWRNDALGLGVRVSAVPEPSSWALMALGLVGAVAAARRRGAVGG